MSDSDMELVITAGAFLGVALLILSCGAWVALRRDVPEVVDDEATPLERDE